jgi:hypothetical protein
MQAVVVTRGDFLQDRQGRTFVDVCDDELPFDDVLSFFSDGERQRRMEEAEVHHDRAPLAGVVREFETLPSINHFFATQDNGRSKRLRQAVGVLVRIIMERRGWQKTGKKGSLGVRSSRPARDGNRNCRHNTGGLALWFLRAERYERADGAAYQTVRERCRTMEEQPRRTNGRESAGVSDRERTPKRRTAGRSAAAAQKKRP